MSSTYTHTETSLDHKALKKPDGFMTALSQFFDKLAKNVRAVALLGIVCLLLIGAGSFWVAHRDTRAAQARNAFFLAERAMETDLKAIAKKLAPVPVVSDKESNKDSKAKEKDKASEPSIESVLFKKLDVDMELKETVTKMKEVTEKFSNTRAAYEAEVTLGKIYYEHGEVSKALPWLVRALASAPNAFEKKIVGLAIGHAQEDLAKYQDALQDYESASKTDNQVIKGDALLSLARVHELMKDSAKARSIYDQIISEMPGSPYAKSAELRKAQIE